MKAKSAGLRAAISLLLSLTAYAQERHPNAVQLSDDPGPMAKQVRSEFLYAWNAYKQYAWGHD